MAILKSPALTGTSLSVAVDGQAPVSFTNYGNVQAGSFTAITADMNLLDDGQGPGTLVVTSQPAEGRVIARPDGKLSYDMRTFHSLEDQVFTYTRDGVAIEATVTMVENWRPAGHAKGDFYMVERDSNDDPVMMLGEDLIIRHVAYDGLDAAEITRRHDGSLNAAALMTTPAKDANKDDIVPTTYYGETEELALDAVEFKKLQDNQFDDYPWRQWYVLYKRGGSYTLPIQATEMTGHSRLYPSIFTTYGTGAAPVFTGDLYSGGNAARSAVNVAVVGPFEYGYQVSMQQSDNVYIDNIFANRADLVPQGDGSYPLRVTFDGSGGLARRTTARRYKTWNVWHQKDATDQGNTWSDSNGDRVSGAYAEDSLFTLYEDFYIDTTGWEPNYYPDRRRHGPKSTDDASHGVYTQGDIIDLTFRNVLTIDGCGSAIQVRSGGVAANIVAIGANMGFLFGNGESPGDDLTPGSGDGNLASPPVFNGEERRATHRSMGHDMVVLEAGIKDVDSRLSILAAGFENSNHETFMRRGAVLNTINDGNNIPDLPQDQPVNYSDGKVTLTSQAYSWRTGDANAPASFPSWVNDDPDIISHNHVTDVLGTGNLPGGIDPGTIEALTSGGYNDLWKSTTGSTKLDLIASLRAEAEPWKQIPAFLDYVQDPLEINPRGRSVAQVVTFLPADGSPGFRADIPDDWDTTDLPGTVLDDDVDIGDFDVLWNITPRNDLKDVTLGAEGRLELSAGHLNWTGNLACQGNNIYVRGGARLRGNSITGTRPSIVVNDGMFVNTGTWSGDIDLKVVSRARAILAREGGAMTFGSGDVLTIGGYAVAGADGVGGGVGAVTFAAGSKLRYQVGSIVNCTNNGLHGQTLDTLTGTLSTTSAVVEDFYRTERDGDKSFQYNLYDLTGAFAIGESLRSSNARYLGWVLNADTGTVMDAGQIVSVTAEFGQLRKFHSGENGITDTNMTLNVTLAGTLEIDLAGYSGTDTFTLIEADSVTGTFDTVTFLNGSGTVDYTATTVTMTVT